MPRRYKPAINSLSIKEILPWSCTHFGDLSEIEACIDGKWETIAEVHPAGDLDAEDIADLIVRAVNECNGCLPGEAEG